MRKTAFLPAILGAAILAATPAQAVQSPASAPYMTKLKCAAINSFMIGFAGEDTSEGAAANDRADAWISAAVAEKANDTQALANDFAKVAEELKGAISAKLDKEDVQGVYAVIDQYQTLCEPYGG
ncbi:MAG: hypothetical protein IE933_15170 [Sphingomonadales bacterium]|nr:hypothetical protein [Sphingomonadales bacterium]MBD3775378.1 hypothetical protein [Paracoccaceae bacterium]